MNAATDITASAMLPARLPKGYELEGFVVDVWLRDGGMAAIHRARRCSDDRRVALKLQLPSTAHDPAMQERFDREVEVIRRAAGSEHVVELLHAGVLADGRRWMAMEWIEGEDLEELLDFLRNQDQRLPLVRACQIGRDVARGLAELHEHGVVHLDLKPANVMVGRRDDGGDAVKLVDFGIAADLRQASASGDAMPVEGVLGTSAYMAPEQVAGEASHPSFDLYAWGVLMYEAISGSCVPPDGWSPETLPRVETLRRGVPRELAELVRSCMEVQAERRPESAAAVVKALVGIIGRLEKGGARASSEDVPVRSGGTQVAVRSGLFAAAAVRESGAVPQAGVAMGSGPQAVAPMAAVSDGAARSGVTEVVHTAGVAAAVRASEEIAVVRTGGTEVARTHEEVLRSSVGSGAVVTTEMVAEAMERLAELEEEEEERVGRRKRRGWVIAAVAGLVAVVGVGVFGMGGGDETKAVAAVNGGVTASAEDSVAGIGPSVHAAKTVEAATPGKEAAEEARPAEPASAAVEDGEDPGDEGSSDDAEGAQPADDPVLASTTSNEPRRRGPSEEACVKMRSEAREAKVAREWQRLLKATARRACWTEGAYRLERTRLRVQAFAERGELGRCVKEGGKSQDRETMTRVDFCKKRLAGTGGGTADPWR